MIGDTGFAMNKNLEWENGAPFEGMRENADFWRWFITYLNDQPMWIPPKPKIQPAPGMAPPPSAPIAPAAPAAPEVVQ